MTVNQAKNIINILSQKWEIKNKDFFLEIIKYLDEKVEKEYSLRHYFEFSLIENEPRMRLLHLFFWQPNLPLRIVEKIIREREKEIAFIFQKVSRKFKCAYNLSLLQSFFQFNQKFGLWPIQFGLEYKKEPPKIKIYLSINGQDFPFNFFCNSFNLKYKILEKKIGQRKLDTIAIDFLPNGEYIFKFYPLDSHRNGWLYRVSKNSEILSIKKWQRLVWGLTLKGMQEKKLNVKLSLFLKNFIAKNNLKISYFCQEGNKKSIYFR